MMSDRSVLAGSGELSKGLSIWYPYIMPSGGSVVAAGSPRMRALRGVERLRNDDPRGVCALLEAAGDFPALMGLAVGEIGLWLSGRGKRHGSQDLLAELSRLRGMYREAAKERGTLPDRTKYAPARLDGRTLSRLREAVRECDDEVRAAWIGRRQCRTMPGWPQVDIILEARADVWMGGNERLRRLLEQVSGRLRAVFDGDVSLLVAVAPYGVRPRVLAAMRKGGEPLLDPMKRPGTGDVPAAGKGRAWMAARKPCWRLSGWAKDAGNALKTMLSGKGRGPEGAMAGHVRALREGFRKMGRRGTAMAHALAVRMSGGFAGRRLVMSTMVFSMGLPLLFAWKVFVDNSDTHARISMLETLRQEWLQNSYWRNGEELASAGPEEVAKAYLSAMRAHDASPLLPLYSGATREMLRKRRLTPVDMDAQVARHAGCGPLKALVNGDSALVRHAEGTCPPFLMKKEDGMWRVDLTVDPALRTLVAETLPLLRGGLREEMLERADARADRLDARS